MYRLCAERARFTDTLDVVKFLCKDVWTAVWDKQIDNLRTNHRVGIVLLLHPTYSLIGNGDGTRGYMCYKTMPFGPSFACPRRTGLPMPWRKPNWYVIFCHRDPASVTSEFSIRCFQRAFYVVHSPAWVYKGWWFPKSRLYRNVSIPAFRSF